MLPDFYIALVMFCKGTQDRYCQGEESYLGFLILTVSLVYHSFLFVEIYKFFCNYSLANITGVQLVNGQCKQNCIQPTAN